MSILELTYQSFITRISNVNKKDILFNLLRRGLFILIFFTALSLLLILLEAVFHFSADVRKYFFFGFVISLCASFVIIFTYALLDYLSIGNSERIKTYAKKIGANIPEIKDNLLNALQLYNYVRSSKFEVRSSKIFSEELAEEGIRQIDKKTRGYNFDDMISFRRNKSLLFFLLGSVLFFTSLLLIFPNIFQASGYRLINYNYSFIENTLGISYEVKPGNIEITKGESVGIWMKIHFNDPQYTVDNLNFYTQEVTNEDSRVGGNDKMELLASATNEFRTEMKNIKSNILYWFEYKGVESEKYKISVSSRPVIKSTQITVYPPAYTKLPSRVIDAGEINTIFGSTIYVEGEASGELDGALLQFEDGSKIKMEIKENGIASSLSLLANQGNNNGIASVAGGDLANRFVASFSAMKNGSFKIIISKEFAGKELTNINPPEYQIHVIPDEYPKVSVIEPSSEFEITNEKEILVRSRITDDFGFTRLRLGYKLSKTKYGLADKDYKYIDIPIKNPDATGLEVPYVWALSSLNLGTEDELEYFVEVFDNDAVSGPKSSKSDIHKLILPSLESLLNKTEKSKEEIETALNSTFEEAEELKQELDELKDKLQKNPEELGLNDPQKNQQLQNKIENIQSQFNSAQQRLDDLMDELQKNNQISKETLDKYMELQKLFSQIDSKELREALKKLQEALRNMSKEKLEEALRNFKFDEEAFKKSLDKTMELLKKILNEQKFGELTKKLDEIAKQQENLKTQTEKTDKNDNNKLNELSKSQEQLQKEYEEFQKQLKELMESMKQLNKNDDIAKQLEKMLKEIQKKALEQKMNESSKNLQNGNKSNSESLQQQLSKELNEMSQSLQDLLAQMLDQENSALMAKMQEILSRLQQMSEKQGELKDKSSGMDKNTDKSEFQKNQQEQQNLSSQLSKAIEDIMSLSQQIPMTPQFGKLLGDAFNSMNKASESLGKQDSKSANKLQGDAKASLDKALEKLQSMCKNGQIPGKGSSLSQLLQMLQQMIERQQVLNQQLGQMNPNGNEGKYTQEQLAQMQRLASEQETIKKNLQQLNEEFKKQQELEGKKLLGNLDQIQKDMQEVIKDLQDNNLTPETRKRQEKILSRLLDFQLSTREKDFEKRRESRPGKDYDRSSPPEIIISKPNIIEGINQDALELQKEQFNEDFETLIQKYREKIKQH